MGIGHQRAAAKIHRDAHRVRIQGALLDAFAFRVGHCSCRWMRRYKPDRRSCGPQNLRAIYRDRGRQHSCRQQAHALCEVARLEDKRLEILGVWRALVCASVAGGGQGGVRRQLIPPRPNRAPAAAPGSKAGAVSRAGGKGGQLKIDETQPLLNGRYENSLDVYREDQKQRANLLQSITRRRTTSSA